MAALPYDILMAFKHTAEISFTFTQCSYNRRNTCEVYTYIVLVEEHLQLPDADPKVCFVELIGNVPTQGAKVPSLLDQPMEEAQPK